ncbi:porin [Prevotella aurantiaca]|uniref:porin n=1 Tax=Prevotella aurantiaca TaxID=596085 RepID=UPI0028E3B67D|nr:porin [Prevotella aurantiaca]
MKHTLLLGALLAVATSGMAQDNHGYGAGDGDFKSLSEEIAKLKKHNDMFNVYFNYAASGQVSQDANKDWGTKFANKQLRIEIKGNITDKLYYRFRHRLNKANGAQNEDNFAKATDIMMVGYKFCDKLKIEAGKMCQIWGGFEFDENPMVIYQYSDMVDNMDNFMAGVTVSLKPVPTQEFAFEISNANNNKFATEYGSAPVSLEKNGTRALEASKNPLTYIANWNGSFFGDKLLTRWSWGVQTQAKHKYSRMLILGQQLNLPKLQWYLDYMGAFDGLDRLKIASSEITAVPSYAGESYFSDVHYNSFITKLNWQFAPKWNLMVKGMYETASVTKVAQLKNYRKSFGYIGSIEYYPVKSQDFRVFLAYVGRKFDYSKASGLQDYNTNRIELGFMYRIKAY